MINVAKELQIKPVMRREREGGFVVLSGGDSLIGFRRPRLAAAQSTLCRRQLLSPI
jgi:hypothetical protein